MADAHFEVVVFPIERKECGYCLVEKGRSARVTHQVVVRGWFGFAAAGGAVETCERHAEAAAAALRACLKGRAPAKPDGGGA